MRENPCYQVVPVLPGRGGADEATGQDALPRVSVRLRPQRRHPPQSRHGQEAQRQRHVRGRWDNAVKSIGFDLDLENKIVVQISFGLQAMPSWPGQPSRL